MQKIKKILLSQPKPTADKSPYFDIENKDNVTIDFKPFIKVEPIAAKEFRQQKINILGQYLKTNDAIGYVVLDVDKGLSKAAVELLKKVKGTIKVRMLY